jgi:UTP--glucose-1-phosphate uridylyltransferase
LNILLRRQNIYSYLIEGKRYDLGNKLDYLKTIIDFALLRKEFARDIRAYMKEIEKQKRKV